MSTRVLLIGAAMALLVAGCSRVDYIDLKPTDAVLTRKGQSLQLHAKPMDQAGNYYPEVMLTWKSSDPSVAKVDDKGMVTAEKSGHAWVSATGKGKTAKVQVQVNLVSAIKILDPEVTLSMEANERFQPRIEVYDAHGQKVEGRQVFLTPADKSIVTVDGQGGLWPQKVGETTVEAKIEGHTGTIHVKVTK